MAGLKDKLQRMWNPPDDEYEYDDYYEDEEPQGGGNYADELLKRHTVVLNLEKTEKEAARRIVDFLSGVAYANNGKIKRVATGTFIITPYNVDLTGDDVLDELESSGLYF